MRKLILLLVVALVGASAALAAKPPAPPGQTQTQTTPTTAGQSQTKSPAQICSAELQKLGASTFNQTYGGSTTASNAFGKCVVKTTQANNAIHANAASDCRKERSADASAFTTKYGTFGKCVSQKVASAQSLLQRTTVQAAKSCKSELKDNPTTFASTYGSGKNAFGKCVSAKSKKP